MSFVWLVYFCNSCLALGFFFVIKHYLVQTLITTFRKLNINKLTDSTDLLFQTNLSRNVQRKHKVAFMCVEKFN